MPINSYSVGRDVTFAIQTATGPLVLSQITGFKAKQDISDVRVKRLDGITDHVRFPDGWSGSFMIERQNSALDDYIAAVEADYYAGLSESPCTITETIAEPNGQTTQYVFYGVLFTLDDAGDWTGESTVKQSVTFVASRRVKRL